MKSLNFSARFIDLASEINSHMPEFVLEKLTRIFNEHQRAIKGSRVAILGMAYKANVSDVRESPALDLFHLLHQKGARVSYHDPYVPSVRIGNETYRSQTYSAAWLRRADAVIITTNHSSFNPSAILKSARLVFDTRNLMNGLSASHLVRL
jgi:UDP-N-acetyl-D-glucosamine dehydrogenase